MAKKMKGFYSHIQSHHRKVKEMISKEMELYETNPVKHVVTVMLVSE